MPTDFRIFMTLFLAVFATVLGAGLVAPLLPIYADELGAGTFQIGLIFGAFSLTRSIFVPYFGKLSDKRGKKPFLTAGLFAYFTLSFLYALSTNVEALILLRLCQGFASAMILPVAQAYVGLITPPRKEGRIMGLFNVSLFGGLSIGPLVGGLIKDWFSIEVSFLSMGALAFLGFLFCVLFLPRETRKKGKRSDCPKEPVRYRDLLRSRNIRSLFLFRACFTACIGITWAFLPLLAGVKVGLSSSAIGVVVMLNVLVAGIFQVPVGVLADRFNKKLLVTSGSILGIMSMLYLNTATSLLQLALANACLGLAGGLSFPPIMALGVVEGRKSGAMGSLMGLLSLAHSLGMLIGPLFAGLLLSFSSYGLTFISGAVILAVGTAALLRSHSSWD